MIDNSYYNNSKLLLETSEVEAGNVAWRSPSNIALIKYWGKHGHQLPRNPSISLTLQNAFTETLIEYAPKDQPSKEMEIEFLFHGEEKPLFAQKIKKYFTSILPIFPFLSQLKFRIQSANSFPHSSGIASSASAMSALALGLCSIEEILFGQTLDDIDFDRKTSYLARLGSGSACRSIYPGIASWGESAFIEDSSDYYATPITNIHELYSTFQDDIFIVSAKEKEVSSRAGHGLMEDNPYSKTRYAEAKKQMSKMLSVLKTGDLESFGTMVENEALTLHALMMSSNPSYLLLKPNTLEMIERIRQYRKETDHPLYFTLDAGPNLHLLYPQNIIHEVRVFTEEQLEPLCEDNLWINDFVGEGPIQL